MSDISLEHPRGRSRSLASAVLRGSILAGCTLIAAACSASSQDEGDPGAAGGSALTLPAGNLTKNPSFETDVSGWISWHGHLEKGTVGDAPDGSGVAKVSYGTGTAYSIDDAPDTVASAVAGRTYVASAWVRSTSGTAGTFQAVGKPVRLYMREWNALNQVVQSTASPTWVLDRTFRQLTASLTAKTSGDRVDVYLAQESAAAGDAFLVDRFTLVVADTSPPTAPANLAKTAATQTSITASWTAATDNVGIARYDLFRNGTRVGSTSSTGYGFTGLACGTSYALAVEAYDGAGNVSARPSISASTAPCATVNDLGRIKNHHAAQSDFDSLVANGCSGSTFFDAHYQRMRAYAPTFDGCISPGGYQGAWEYHDVQAIYKTSSGTPTDPQWVLKDASGKYLYVDFNCANGTCPQYAADIGNQAFRDKYVAETLTELAKGYRGVFVDDANVVMNISDGSGTPVAPIDPRTGAAMTVDNFRRYMAETLEQVRAHLPAGKEQVNNSVWWQADLSNAYVLRILRSGTHVELERGVSDVYTNGRYDRMLSFIDARHAEGVSVVYDDYHADTAVKAELEVATYLLANDGNDAVGTAYRSVPTNWWSAYDAHLGSASGGRYAWNGLYRRDFSGGMALVNKPGAAASITVNLGATFRDLAGSAVTSVTLGAGQGKILLR